MRGRVGDDDTGALVDKCCSCGLTAKQVDMFVVPQLNYRSSWGVTLVDGLRS